MKRYIRSEQHLSDLDGKLVGILIKDKEFAQYALSNYLDVIDDLYLNWQTGDSIDKIQSHYELLQTMLNQQLTIEDSSRLDECLLVGVTMKDNIIISSINLSRLSENQIEAIEEHLGARGYSDHMIKNWEDF